MSANIIADALRYLHQPIEQCVVIALSPDSNMIGAGFFLLLVAGRGRKVCCEGKRRQSIKKKWCAKRESG